MLTAGAYEVPASHDGSQTFTFELWFSEHVPLSYATLRDHSISVTDAEVVKVKRMVKNENQRWTVHVAPNGNATATLTLPTTTDCEAQGAICTADGRKLSGDLTVSVLRRNDAPTGAPAIQGNAHVGQILTADTSSISDGNGVNTDTFTCTCSELMRRICRVHGPAEKHWRPRRSCGIKRQQKQDWT